MVKIREKHAQKVRYILVGGSNTVLDFLLLFLFTGLGVNKIVANYMSTGISMIISFVANRKFTFKNKSGNKKRQFALFIAITVFGMWVIQPLVIHLATNALAPHINSTAIELFIAKVIATGASMVWNYLMYSRIVFAERPNKSVNDEETTK